jgi:prolyl-tRNA editing enzyme YbaK/EbsC (Cys-tRNA(Pro) deacylase)
LADGHLIPLRTKDTKFIELARLLYTVIEHAESTRTAQEAADRAGCELGQIVKSLIFKGKESGKPILVLTSGPNRVNEKRISEYAGEPIGKADADFVRAVTGFAIGGVPPIGHMPKKWKPTLTKIFCNIPPSGRRLARPKRFSS